MNLNSYPRFVVAGVGLILLGTVPSLAHGYEIAWIGLAVAYNVRAEWTSHATAKSHKDQT